MYLEIVEASTSSGTTTYTNALPTLPEMSVGAGVVDIEKIFAFAKRTVSGKMLLRGYKGSVLKFSGKWSILSYSQFTALCNYLTSHDTFLIRVCNPMKTGVEKQVISAYPGNIHAEPLFVNKATGFPTYYQNCTVNFISVETI